MYAKYRLYQRFYLPFMIVASLHFAGTLQTVASQVNEKNHNKKPYDVIKENVLPLAIVGVFLSVGAVWWGINKNVEKNENKINLSEEITTTDEAESGGATQLIGDYLFISDKDGKNKAYTPLLFLVWYGFDTEYCQGKGIDLLLGVTGNAKKKAEKMIEYLKENASKRVKGIMDDDAIKKLLLMMVGMLPATLKKFNSTAKAMFGYDTTIFFDEEEFKNVKAAALAGLKVKMSYAMPFFKKKLAVEGKTVEAFGCDECDEQTENIIEVMHDKEKGKCIVQLKTKDKDPLDLFLCQGFENELQEGITLIKKGNYTRYSGAKELTVPKVKMTFESNFEDIFAGATMEKGKLKGLQFIAYEKIEFVMDEKGVEAEGKGLAGVLRGASSARHYKFDKQFYIVLASKKTKESVIIIDVNGTSAMTEIK